MTDKPTTEEPTPGPTEGGIAGDPCAATASGCKEAVEQLYEFLDGELTDERRTSIGLHIDGCGHCLDAYEFHAELKTVISQKCRTELPDGLKDRVFNALRALDS